MQASMGQTAATLFNSIENETLEDGETTQMDSQLLQVRQRFLSSIKHGMDCSESLLELLHLDCSVVLKYSALNVLELLQNNNQSVEEIKRIPVALNILEKYGRHLLKPSNLRNNLWRYVKFSNPIFRDRVEPLRGSISIMKMMGYTEEIDDGLFFPVSNEPDLEKTANIVADITLAKKEIETYLNGTHPQPSVIEKYLPPQTVATIRNMRNGVPVSSVIGATGKSESHHPAPGGVPLSCQGVASFFPGRKESSPDIRTLPQGASSQCGEIPGSPPEARQSKKPHRACDICGEQPARFLCKVCDSKQLCKTCDDMWHKHPKRVNHAKVDVSLMQPPAVSSAITIQGPYGIQAVPGLPPAGSFSRDGVSLMPKSPPVSPKSLEVTIPPVDSETGYVSKSTGSSPSPSSALSNLPKLDSLVCKSTEINPSQLLQEPLTHHYDVPTSTGTKPPPAVPDRKLKPQHLASTHKTRAKESFDNTLIDTTATDMKEPPTSYPLHHVYQPVVSTSTAVPSSVISTTPLAQGPAPQKSTSKLLSGIMAIPDIDKQRAKCEINILTLREERDEIEEKLNKIIEINENFYQDDEFMTLNRKKGVLYREVVALEKYKANLDSQQAQKTGMKPSLEENNLSQEVFYPPVVQYSHGSISQATVPMSVAPFPPNVPEMPSQRINDFQGSYGVLNDVRGGQISNTAPVLRQNVKSAPQNFRGSVQRMEASPYSNNESFYHSAVGQQSEYPQQFSQQPYPSDIGRMAGYPHVLSPPPVSQQAYFPPPSTFIHGYDPNIPPTIRPETLRLQPQQNITRHIVSPSGDPAEKQNIAGTFRNSASDPNFSPGSDLVPELKTPQLPSVSHSKRGSLKTSGYNQRWHCQHCTMINDAGTRVCEMCHKTSDMPTFVDDDVAGAAAASEHDEETSITRAEPTGVGQRIAEVQDQIYFEKKEAHKRFQESMRKEKELEKQKKQEQIALPKSEPIENISSQHLKNPAHLERKPSQHLKPLIVDHRRSSGYGSVDTTENEYESVQLRGNHNNSLQAKHTSFQETIECINEQRHLKQMQLDGVDVVQLVKTADKHGYDIDEIQVALENCSQDGVSALEWLNQHWERMIDNVVAAVTLEGTHLDQNDVGELSASEAKEVLKACGGNMDEAVKEGLTMRKKLYAEVNREGLYARENVLEAMLQNKGDKENILISLDQTRVQPFVDRVWDTGRTEPNVLQMVINESCNSVATSVISHEDFQEQVKNKDVDLERRIRMIMVEARLISWGRAETVIKILDHDLETMDQGYECTLEDIVEAVRNCQDRRSSLVYLQRECQLCFTKYPMSKIRNLNFCQCQMCVDCLKQNFEVAIREKHVRNWVCPLCGLPDLNNENITSEYLSFLAMLLQTMMDKEVQDLFETKVRDWHLQKDPNFRWCAHCGNGFLFQDVRLDMTCPHCTKKSCFKCKKQWEDQHKGLTCEEFEQWKIDNDPENQAIGLAKHLEESGIDCPSCKMRYSLAKGGCMHFKCPQCVHEFCSGCYQPFYKKGACKRFKQCQNQGFHCHHPRDCFFYLRDNDVKDLQKLLEDGKIDFNTATPANQEQPNRCPVMEQKEYDYGKQDEACGKEVPNGHAGLCVNHYKEYLVGLINRKRLDPVRIMSHEDMNRFLLRMEIQVPKKRENENNTAYKKRLAQMIKDRFPLQRS